MPQIETYNTGSQLLGINDVTGTTSGCKTFLDTNSALSAIDTSTGERVFLQVLGGNIISLPTRNPIQEELLNKIFCQLKILTRHKEEITDHIFTEEDCSIE